MASYCPNIETDKKTEKKKMIGMHQGEPYRTSSNFL